MGENQLQRGFIGKRIKRIIGILAGMAKDGIFFRDIKIKENFFRVIPNKNFFHEEQAR